MENTNTAMNRRKEYRSLVQQSGKKEFTLLKMQEYGFWPANLPTPYERQANETPDQYRKRKNLLQELDQLAGQISELCKEKEEISRKVYQLRKEYDQTWDLEKIRKDVAQTIMQESLARRAEKKRLRELLKAERHAAWKQDLAENIRFIGKGYSNLLGERVTDDEKLMSLNLPAIHDDKELADFLGLEYKQLRYLCYHRDVVEQDHYHRFSVPKRNGKERSIAAPKPMMKQAQKLILEKLLELVPVSGCAHGFIKAHSVVSGALVHEPKPELLINMDLENFFPTITFERVRGMFHALGYSGYIASLLAMLSTYCERMPIEVKGRIRYVKTSDRILPQGSPASPMITNIICRNLDRRLEATAAQYHCQYSRYADDMSFSFPELPEKKMISAAAAAIVSVVEDEGFYINRDKTRYLKKNNRQCVTGIVINHEEPGVSKIWMKRMRAAIYNAGKKKEAGTLEPSSIREISGMVSWLKAVNPGRYQRLIDAAKQVIGD